MAIDLGTATVQIATDTSQLSRGIDGAKVLMLGLAAGAAAAAGEALKMAGNFEAANTRLATSAGESQKNLAMVSAGVLQISVDTATSTDQLEAGMYTIESSGAHGKQALDELAAAARGAKSENADLKDVANAETTIMVDYADKHITAANAVNDLIATVSRGKTTLQDLSASFSNVLPTANAVGVSLYDVSGAMATMTGEGVDAASAATYLRQLLLNLEAPGTKAADTLKAIGLTTAQVANEMKISLPDTLAMIEDHLKSKFPEGSAAYVEAVKNIAGGTKTIQGILDLTGTHLDVFKQNVAGVTEAVKSGGTQIDGFALAQHNLNFQVDQAKASFDELMIKVGDELMPIVEQFLSQDVEPAITHFEDWATNTTGLHDTFITLSGVLGTVISDVETLASDTASVVSWFQQAGPQGTALKGVLEGIGVAVGTIKMIELANSVKAFATTNLSTLGFLKGDIADIGTNTATSAATVTTETAVMDADFAGVGTAAATAAGEEGIGAIASKTLTARQQAQADINSLIASFDTAKTDVATDATDMEGSIKGVGASAVTVAGEEGIGSISTAATTTATDVATASTAMEGSLGGVLGALKGIGIGLAGFGAMGMVPDTKSLSPNSDVVQAYDKGMNIDQYEKWKQSATDAAKQVKQQLDGINQAWKDMNSLYDQYNNRVLGVLGQPNKIDSADLKVMTLKSSLDDVSNGVYLDNNMKPTIFTLLTKQAETADNTVRIYKDHIDDLTNAVDAYNKMIGFTGTPHPINVSAYTSHSGQDDTSGLGMQPGVGTRGFTGHSSGGVIPPGQYGMVDDQPGASNGELMYGGTSGISVLPAGPTGALLGGGGGIGPLYITIQVGTKEVASAIVDDVMNLATKKIRVVAGVRR